MGRRRMVVLGGSASRCLSDATSTDGQVRASPGSSVVPPVRSHPDAASESSVRREPTTGGRDRCQGPTRVHRRTRWWRAALGRDDRHRRVGEPAQAHVHHPGDPPLGSDRPTVVAYGGPDVGLLCRSGQASKISGFVSLDTIPLSHTGRRQSRSIRAGELDEGACSCRACRRRRGACRSCPPGPASAPTSPGDAAHHHGALPVPRSRTPVASTRS